MTVEMRLGAFYDTIFGNIDFCRFMVYDEEKCIVWEGLKVDFLKNINLFFDKYGVTIEGIDALIGIITVAFSKKNNNGPLAQQVRSSGS